MPIPLPLTLAIVDCVSIALDEMFNIPLSYGTESLQPWRADIKSISGQRRA